MKNRDDLLEKVAAKMGYEYGHYVCPKCGPDDVDGWHETKVWTGAMYIQLRPICSTCGRQLTFEVSK